MLRPTNLANGEVVLWYQQPRRTDVEVLQSVSFRQPPVVLRRRCGGWCVCGCTFRSFAPRVLAHVNERQFQLVIVMQGASPESLPASAFVGQRGPWLQRRVGCGSSRKGARPMDSLPAWRGTGVRRGLVQRDVAVVRRVPCGRLRRRLRCRFEAGANDVVPMQGRCGPADVGGVPCAGVGDFGPLVAVVVLGGADARVLQRCREPRFKRFEAKPLCRLRFSDVGDALLEGRSGPLERCDCADRLLDGATVVVDAPCNRIVRQGSSVRL